MRRIWEQRTVSLEIFYVGSGDTFFRQKDVLGLKVVI